MGIRHVQTLPALVALFAGAMFTACAPSQTLVVRFDDLRSDLIVLEASLEREAAAGFDWREGRVPVTEPSPGARGASAGQAEGDGTNGVVRKNSPKIGVVVLGDFAETDRGRVTFEMV